MENTIIENSDDNRPTTAGGSVIPKVVQATVSKDYSAESSHILCQKHPLIVSLMDTFSRLENDLDGLEVNCKPSLAGERYLTDKQLSSMFHISRRSLFTCRNEGILPYYMLNGKILYKESDIQKILEERFYDKFQ